MLLTLLLDLVAKSIMRTEKFLIALNHAPEIVSQSWIIACIKAKALIGGWHQR